VSEFTCCQLAASGASDQIRIRKGMSHGFCATVRQRVEQGQN
jgi:hypothetical protein